MKAQSAICTAIVWALFGTSAHAEESWNLDGLGGESAGSLATAEPLGDGVNGMSVGGGLAVILPYMAVEAGYGLSDHVDLVGRYTSVLGLIHFPELGVRWSPLTWGDGWHLGGRLGAVWSLFGLQSEELNLTSTLYLTPELVLSGSVTDATVLVFGLGSEYDLVEFRVVDDESRNEGRWSYDATNARVGFQTEFTQELDVYVMLRVRVPIETFTYEDTFFTALPFLDAGGTWTW